MELAKMKKLIRTQLPQNVPHDLRDNENLFSTRAGIRIFDMVLFVRRIEQAVGYEITGIFQSNDNSVMTIESLAKEVLLLSTSASRGLTVMS